MIPKFLSVVYFIWFCTFAFTCAFSPCGDSLRKAAWIGDAAHKFDTRYAILLNCTVACNGLERKSQEYVTNAAQTAYWLSYDTRDLYWQPRGTNNHSLATAFEANYYGAFRIDYLVAAFGFKIASNLAWLHPPNVVHCL